MATVAGDRVLQAAARCLAACVRPQDTVARYGGEEFAIVLPDCQLNYGEAVAERIRQAVASLSIEVAPGLALQITLSVGGAFAPTKTRYTPTSGSNGPTTSFTRPRRKGATVCTSITNKSSPLVQKKKVSCSARCPQASRHGVKIFPAQRKTVPCRRSIHE